MRIPTVLTILSVVLGVTFVSSSASAQRVQLFAVLAGGNVVSADGQAAAGKPGAYGSATAIVASESSSQHTLCIGVIVFKLNNPSAMHIHAGRAGENGPIVLTLNPPAAGDPGHRSQCTSISDVLAETIRLEPARFYLDVHAGAFPNGAVRGQFF